MQISDRSDRKLAVRFHGRDCRDGRTPWGCDVDDETGQYRGKVKGVEKVSKLAV